MPYVWDFSAVTRNWTVLLSGLGGTIVLSLAGIAPGKAWLVATKARGNGSVAIRYNGVLVKTVNLAAPRTTHSDQPSATTTTAPTPIATVRRGWLRANRRTCRCSRRKPRDRRRRRISGDMPARLAARDWWAWDSDHRRSAALGTGAGA